jgi:deoxyuridine 5'-triphosphate nucleotidohydrolase
MSSSTVDYLRDCFTRKGQVVDWNEAVTIDLKDEDRCHITSCMDELGIPYSVLNDTVQYVGTNAQDFMGLIGRHGYLMSQRLMSDNAFMVSCVCKVFKMDPSAVLPFKTRESDVGYDLTLLKEHKRVNSVCTMYDTGLKIQVSKGFYAEIVPRSSIIKSGYMLANSIGIIDRSYFGNLYVAVVKVDPDALPLPLPFRGFQLIFRPQVYADIVEGNDQGSVDTSRGKGGIGSTGGCVSGLRV